MKVRHLIFGLIVLAPSTIFHGQAPDSTLYAKQFPGNDVGTKVANAIKACATYANGTVSVPCLITIDPSLVQYNAGTLPTIPVNVYIVDYRDGPPIYSGETVTKAPVPVGPAPIVPPIGIFVVTNGATAADCSAGGGSNTNVCLTTPSGPIVVGGSTSYPGVASDAANGLAVTGSVAAKTVNASVNTQMNVMTFGAKGDCSTNDTAAFNAAQTAAVALAVGNSLPAGLYLPKPPGGCYIVSNWLWQGVSLIGQPSGLGPSSPAQYNVTLRSLPGQDIIHIPDPTTTTGTIHVYGGWAFENVSFLIDNSSAGSFPNRFPGRSFDDAAMTAGSPILKTTGGNVSCGDVGQAVQVNGAGASGANLVTTIASVTPCWANRASIPSWQVVTLSANAGTTVTGAHAYISLLGLPVTQTVGNAAIALDMQDGNQSDWVASSYFVGSYGRMDNVVFQNTSGHSNFVAALWSQGSAWLYGLKAENLNVYGTYFGIIQTSTVLNSSLQSSSGDFEQWDHPFFLGVANPWISVNGLSNKILQAQDTSFTGFQILTDSNTAGDYPDDWIIEHSFECPYGSSCGIGDHITGAFDHISAAITDSNNPGTGQNGYLDIISGVCENCGLINTFLGGTGNKVLEQNQNSLGFVEQGAANEVTSAYNPGTSGIPSNYRKTQIPYKGSNNIGGRYTPDFLEDGNYATPYNRDDLFIWPTDLVFSNSTPWASVVVADSTSPSGYYINWTAGTPYTSFSQFSAGLVVGTNLPDTGVVLSMRVKCPTAVTSFTVMYGNTGSTHPQQTFTCSTSYANYSMVVTYTGGDNGLSQNIWNEGANSFYAAWVNIAPFRLINGLALSPGGAIIPSGPATAAVAHSFACFASTTDGHLEDSSNNGNNACVMQPATGSASATLKSTNGHAFWLLDKGGSSLDASIRMAVNGAQYWDMGMYTTSNWVVRDFQAGNNVVSFPSNQMPANSIAGNSNGATAITQAESDNSTNIATDAYVRGLIITAGLTTTAATSDNVTVTGMTSSGHCELTATSASAATNIATTYISAKATNQITVTHTATAGMTYDVKCTPN